MKTVLSSWPPLQGTPARAPGFMDFGACKRRLHRGARTLSLPLAAIYLGLAFHHQKRPNGLVPHTNR